MSGWVSACLRIHADFSTLESRMDFVIQLARQHIKQKTGGPFAAAIFNMDNQQLLAVGLNIVVPSHGSNHHAEMVAITLAQQALQTHDLRKHGDFELLSSCEPCAMCAGALPWSGIRHVAYAAASQDAEALGFDEGEKPQGWTQALQARGIAVSCHVLRGQAAQTMQLYQGAVY